MIGYGGMGVVYRARELNLNRGVAIKLLRDRYPADSGAARRFVEEAQIGGQLQHPGIRPGLRARHAPRRPARSSR